MTIEEPNIVDIVSYPKDDGNVRLVISDHLPWSGDDDGHLEMLRQKINTCVHCVQSGQLYEGYPAVRKRPIVIQIVNKYPLSAKALSQVESWRKSIAHTHIGIVVGRPWEASSSGEINR